MGGLGFTEFPAISQGEYEHFSLLSQEEDRRGLQAGLSSSCGLRSNHLRPAEKSDLKAEFSLEQHSQWRQREEEVGMLFGLDRLKNLN